MLDLLFLPLIFCALWLISILCRMSKIVSWAILAVLAGLFMAASYLFAIDISWFTRIKVYTLLLSYIWINSLRFTALSNRRWAFMVLWVILAANIFEAVLRDFEMGRYANMFVGIILILTQTGWKSIEISENAYRDLEWPLPVAWILTYSMWNFTFVFANYTTHISDHVGVLGAPLICLLSRPKTWFQARGYTLSVYALIIVLWIEVLHAQWPHTLIPYSEGVYTGLSICSVLLAMMHVGIGLKTSGRRFTMEGWARKSHG